MKVLRSKTTLSTAIFQPCGNGYMIKVNNIIKIFDNEQTALNYLSNLQYQF